MKTLNLPFESLESRRRGSVIEVFIEKGDKIPAHILSQNIVIYAKNSRCQNSCFFRA